LEQCRRRRHCQSVRSHNIYGNGRIKAFWRGLIPWAWIESAGAGAALLFTAAEVESLAVRYGANPGTAGLLGGMSGGVAQAYLFMGFCTCMKTAEVTRNRQLASASGAIEKVPSTIALFADIIRKEGIMGVNKGVNAVAVRQCTNWGSRMGFARLAEQLIRNAKRMGDKDPLGAGDKILASSIGGALGCWNHPIEVVRVEMQSMVKSTSVNRPAKLTILSTFKYIYKENGIRGLFQGVTPRICLSVWRTVCMVSLADFVKDYVAASRKK